MSKQAFWCTSTFLMLATISTILPMHVQACVENDCLPLIESNTQATANNTAAMGTALEDIKTKTESQNTSWQDYLEKYLQLNYDPTTKTPLTPFIPVTPGLDTSFYQTLNDKEQAADVSTTDDVQSLINLLLQNNINLEQLMTTDFANITPNSAPPPAGFFFPDPNVPNNNASINVNTLIGKNFIPGLNSSNKSNESGLGKMAINLIKIISGAANPFPMLQEKGDKSNEQWAKYLANAWSNNARLSLVLSNFYHMLRLREEVSGFPPIPGIMDPANPNSPKTKFSPLEVEEYAVTKRLHNPQWYTEMEAASPIRLKREAVYLLAEIHRLLHRNYKQDERMLATLSVLVAQGIDMSKAMIQINEEIEKAKAQAANVPEFEMPTFTPPPAP